MAIEGTGRIKKKKPCATLGYFLYRGCIYRIDSPFHSTLSEGGLFNDFLPFPSTKKKEPVECEEQCVVTAGGLCPPVDIFRLK